MSRLKLFVLLGTVLLIAGAGGGVAAQSSRWVEKGSGPHCIGRALTEEEAAAGVSSEVECFDTFEKALRSINVEPEDLKTTSLAPPDAAGTTDADETAEAPSGAGLKGHCAASPGQEPLVVSCFDTFSDAIYFATGGAVRLPATVGPDELTEEMLQPAADRTVISVEYKDPNYSGQSFVWYVNNSFGCTTGWSYAQPTMPSGWNDVISSSASYGGCTYVRHYEHTYYGGSKIDCTCATMGAMNDKTSSLKWSRTQPSP
jgi:hypothetical protein